MKGTRAEWVAQFANMDLSEPGGSVSWGTVYGVYWLHNWDGVNDRRKGIPHGPLMTFERDWSKHAWPTFDEDQWYFVTVREEKIRDAQRVVRGYLEALKEGKPVQVSLMPPLEIIGLRDVGGVLRRQYVGDVLSVFAVVSAEVIADAWKSFHRCRRCRGWYVAKKAQRTCGRCASRCRLGRWA